VCRNNLREIRKARGLTQFALAKISNVSPADISKIENNLVKPYPAWRQRIAAALGMPEDKIFPGFEEADKENQAG